VYRVRRTRFAIFLLSDEGGYAVASFAILVIVYVTSAAVHLLVPRYILEELHRAGVLPSVPAVVVLGNRHFFLELGYPSLYRWSQEQVAFLMGGILMMSIVGFIEFLRAEFAVGRLMAPERWMQHALVTFSCVAGMSQMAIGRVVVLLGMLAAAKVIVSAAIMKGKEFAQVIGENLEEAI
jgi:hypothetical protein